MTMSILCLPVVCNAIYMFQLHALKLGHTNNRRYSRILFNSFLVPTNPGFVPLKGYLSSFGLFSLKILIGPILR